MITGVCALPYAANAANAATSEYCLKADGLEELLKKYDFDRDGCIDSEEVKVFQRDVAVMPKPKPKPPAPKKDPFKPAPVFLVRDAYPTGAAITNDTKVSDAGALVSYTDDRIAKQSALAIKGAVIAGFVWDRELTTENLKANSYLSRVALLTGMEFDRSIQNGSKNTGSQSAKGGFEFEYFSPNSYLIRQYVKADAVYTTDFDGKASIFGFEAFWQPMTLGFIGKTTQLTENVWLNFRPTLALDYFHVADDGVFKTLTPGDNYLWAGTKISASLIFDNLWPDVIDKSLTFEAKYIYLAETLNPSSKRNIDYVQVTASYPIYKDNLFLQARYTNGNTPRTLTRQDEFYAGLTIKLGEIPSSPTSVAAITPAIVR
ncbi:hypothetical protein [Bradyrhizobium prioriisuperbiae]|uniref:hypothetical protein n=1 Tax=Bradyrhizobium prioriisuperbiae TaxID=2854389 RepID=UPI0028E5061F|nr:hypothetical protein [Bradyrhizobium prioritasuperba]